MNSIPQRGLISLPLSGYIALGACAVILALGLALKLQSARLDASQQENKALAQQVSLWTAAAQECSQATDKAAKEAEKRNKAAQDALARARVGNQASETEITRLRALMGQKGVTGCPAGEAVAKVRDGLKP